MSDINRGTVPVPLTSEGVKEVKFEPDAAAAPAALKSDPATMQTDAGAEAASSGFVSVAAMSESDDPSNQLKQVAETTLCSHTQEGEDLHQTQSTGGIAFLTSLSAEALHEFDMPEYVKRHNATLTFPEKVRPTDIRRLIDAGIVRRR